MPFVFFGSFSLKLFGTVPNFLKHREKKNFVYNNSIKPPGYLKKKKKVLITFFSHSPANERTFFNSNFGKGREWREEGERGWMRRKWGIFWGTPFCREEGGVGGFLFSKKKRKLGFNSFKIGALGANWKCKKKNDKHSYGRHFLFFFFFC